MTVRLSPVTASPGRPPRTRRFFSPGRRPVHGYHNSSGVERNLRRACGRSDSVKAGLAAAPGQQWTVSGRVKVLTAAGGGPRRRGPVGRASGSVAGAQLTARID